MPQKNSKTPSSFITGLAFFSMFFGSGNLIFPLFLGQYAQSQWPIVFLGFLLGGVIAPFIGVLTMVAYRGDTHRFFSSIGPLPALIFSFILTAVWIPLGAAPRCINVAYESFITFIPIPLWLFGVIYSTIVLVIISKRSRMLEILGYFLTPILLACLAVLWVIAVATAPEIPQSTQPAGQLFYLSLVQGYSTMDLIAAFFFSASLIHILQRMEGDRDPDATMKKALRSGCIGMGILGIVYLALIYMAAKNHHLLNTLTIEQLLPYISTKFLGPTWGIIPVCAIVLACLTTSIAMLTAYGEFLQREFLKKGHAPYVQVVIGASIVTFLMSLLGLEKVMALVSPILQIGCPLLILLVIYNFYKKNYNI